MPLNLNDRPEKTESKQSYETSGRNTTNLDVNYMYVKTRKMCHCHFLYQIINSFNVFWWANATFQPIRVCVLFLYLKFPPNPLLCWRVCANISYFLMSLSLTERRANLIASSKWSFLISGTGSSSSTSYKSKFQKHQQVWCRVFIEVNLSISENMIEDTGYFIDTWNLSLAHLHTCLCIIYSIQ